MIGILFKVLKQLPERGLRRPVALSALCAFTLIIPLAWGSWEFFQSLDFIDYAILDWALALLGMLTVVTLAIMFFSSLVMFISGFFLDSVADAVENRHYPGLPAPRRQSLREIGTSALALLLISVAVNLVLLPAYLLALFVPGLSLVLFYLANGYILGREYFWIVASRRLRPQELMAVRRAGRWSVLGAGAMIAGLTTIPVVNLFMPVIATAVMVHLFHRLQAKQDT